jgi:hypothetical protein
MSAKKKLKIDSNDSKIYYTNLCIPIKSSTSDDIYKILIYYDDDLEDYEFKCTCGLKFNAGLRIKCKHITFIKEEITTNKINIDLFNNCDNDQLLSQFSNLTV